MKSENVSGSTTVAQRLFSVVRQLANAPAEGARITDVARAIGLTHATTYRLLQSLAAEGIVEQDQRNKRYRLGIEFFVLAAHAGNPGDLRTICRPTLLRLGASLGDSIFLLARSGFDAICLDRGEGPFAIQSFTGDVGGRVALGGGQGGLAILAFLADTERDEVIRFNLPRLREFGIMDEVQLRIEIDKVRNSGFANRTGLLEGMAGVAVPVLDREGRAVAAFAVGTIVDRLRPDRLPTVVDLLKREAAAISLRINPFDVLLRRPAQALLGQ